MLREPTPNGQSITLAMLLYGANTRVRVALRMKNQIFVREKSEFFRAQRLRFLRPMS